MNDVFAPATLLDLIEEYSAQGIHRTGWAADERCSDWLIEWLGRNGITSQKSTFRFPRLESRAAYVDVGGVRTPGIPLHDGAPTSPAGVTGDLTRPSANLKGKVVVAVGQPELPPLLETPEGARPAAVIVITSDPEGNVLLRNGEAIDHPFDLPVIQVARRDARPIQANLESCKQATVVLDFKRAPGSATNVVGSIAATPGAPLVVVMTPKSGWFNCAAERGGGLVITMALAAHARQSAARSKELLFLFTSGHEINYYGLLEHLKANPDLRDRAETWVQLGASIGAKNQPAWRVLSRDDALRAMTAAALERQGLGPVMLAPKDQRPSGEAREVFDKRFVALAGGHPYFHSPADLPELSVDAVRVSRFGLALREVLETLVS